MVGARSDTSVVRRGVSAHGTWEEKREGEGKQEQGAGDGAVLSQENSSTWERGTGGFWLAFWTAAERGSLACLSGVHRFVSNSLECIIIMTPGFGFFL